VIVAIFELSPPEVHILGAGRKKTAQFNTLVFDLIVAEV
jgi:hypothetical protein